MVTYGDILYVLRQHYLYLCKACIYVVIYAIICQKFVPNQLLKGLLFLLWTVQEACFLSDSCQCPSNSCQFFHVTKSQDLLLVATQFVGNDYPQPLPSPTHNWEIEAKMVKNGLKWPGYFKMKANNFVFQLRLCLLLGLARNRIGMR